MKHTFAKRSLITIILASLILTLLSACGGQEEEIGPESVGEQIRFYPDVAVVDYAPGTLIRALSHRDGLIIVDRLDAQNALQLYCYDLENESLTPSVILNVGWFQDIFIDSSGTLHTWTQKMPAVIL